MSKEIQAEAGKKNRNRYPVTAEDFVVAWQTSSTAKEVAEKLGMPKTNVLARASNYRSRGVQLKSMRRANPRKLNVEKLNTLSPAGDGDA